MLLFVLLLFYVAVFVCCVLFAYVLKLHCVLFVLVVAFKCMFVCYVFACLWFVRVCSLLLCVCLFVVFRV